MTTFAGLERAALCDLLAEVGPDAATLCAPWTTYDLAAHFVLRERRPVSAVGIVAPPLAPLTRRTMRRLKARHDYPTMLEQVRGGPPRWSPYAAPKVAHAAEPVELFVHHEDVRRAMPHWQPRELPFAAQNALWSRLRAAGRLLVRRSPVGLEVVRTDSPDSVRLKKGEPTVVARGLPSELMLFCFGRGSVADIELEGDEAAIGQLRDARLGL